MGGRIAAQAEVAGRGDQSSAEMPLPDAVDQHPRGQRIPRVGDRSRQLEPAAPLLERRSRSARRAAAGTAAESPGRAGRDYLERIRADRSAGRRR